MKLKAVCAAACALFACHAFAQSSVTLSGLIDGGVSYVSNQGGSRVVKFDDGIEVPNLLKIDGREDLGGGLKAVFDLTNQFTLGTGSFMPGQSLFGRNAYVGLDDQQWGRITLGNQYDFMVDSLFFGLDDAAFYAQGVYDFRNGPFAKLALPNNPTGAFDWDRMAGERVQNSVKYLSPTIDGFSAGAMYGFGNVAGSIGAGNAQSFGLNYVNGPFGANAAYTLTKTAVAGVQDSVRNWGVGAHYHIGNVVTTALFTTVHNNLNGAGVWQAEVGAAYSFDSPWLISGVYSYMKGNSVVDDNHAHQLTAEVQYNFSKRTNVYVAAVYQRANQGANAQINDVMVASSSASQFIGRIGLQTRF
ncbi:porin [Trinickia violacea]|uniref:Porin n=1 Tax=Trinickia violacea TaxID=2571746 RepID=A0A4P8IXR1_9BURK|nr:porin [Trinickia violacea]QCP54102.1 porin [Trinickia violacea]